MSVVIPTLDAERTLGAQLDALSTQDYRGAWEVVIVDNGSSDDSMEVAKAFSTRLPLLRLAEARDQRSAAHARNVGVSVAGGDFIAFCDADDVVGPGWLGSLVTSGRSYDIVGGPVHATTASGSPEKTEGGGLPVTARFLPFAFSGNIGIWREVFIDIGGWAEGYVIGEDVELSWRAQLRGYRVGFAPGADLWRRDPVEVRRLAIRSFRYGMAAARLYRDYRHVGARWDLTEAWRAVGWLVVHAPAAVGSLEARRRWVNVLARRAGRLAGAVRYRVVYV